MRKNSWDTVRKRIAAWNVVVAAMTPPGSVQQREMTHVQKKPTRLALGQLGLGYCDVTASTRMVLDPPPCCSLVVLRPILAGL